MKYPLKVTIAVMIIRLSKKIRVREGVGRFCVGSSSIPIKRNGYADKKATSAQDGNGG
jgi:hypothetical protein